MLQFVFGRASSGKTTKIHNLIKKASEEGIRDLILLVPEQYSFETEKEMLSVLDSGFMSKVQVQSFTRLASTAGRLYGGIAGIRLTDTERIMLLGSVIKKIASSLNVFKKYVDSTVFVGQVASVIFEFKTAGITTEDISGSLDKIKNQSLKNKLSELLIIYTEYENILKEKGMYLDPLNDLEDFCKKAAQYEFFKGKTVYVDAFKGFTGQQLKVLKLIISTAAKTVISLCADNEIDEFEGVGLFSNIKAAAIELKTYAENCGVGVEKPIYLPENVTEDLPKKSPELKALEKHLAGELTEKYSEPAKNIVIGTFDTPAEELEFIFKTIHRLVRKRKNSHYKYKDFVIIARDISKYESRLELAAKKFDVPCYFDRRKPLMASPIARFVISILGAAKRFNTNSIISMLKTGFFDISTEEIAFLEEYVYTWDINGFAWKGQWTMALSGLKADFDGKAAKKDEPRLKKLNELRGRVIAPLIKLNSSFSGDVKDISNGVYEALVSLKIPEKVKTCCDEFSEKGDLLNADFVMDSWDEVMDALDSMVNCFEDTTLTADEYIELLTLAFNSATVGTVPRMIDEVSIGSADRIRPARPRVTFVMGLCQGEFPANVNDSGLLLKNDRALMAEADINISDRFRQFAVDENYLVYASLCSPKEKVYALSHRYEVDGTKVEESGVVLGLREFFPKANFVRKNVSLPETVNDALDTMIKDYFSNSSLNEALKESFEYDDNLKSKIEPILRAVKDNTRRLSKEVLERLYEDDVFLSATGIENYNKCAYSYFCKYVLGITVLQKAELNNLKRGIIAHYVLEKVLGELRENIATTKDDDINKLIEEAMSEYLSNIAGAENIKTPRFEFLFSQIGKMLKYVLKHIKTEFQNSNFRPVGFEVNIDNKGEADEIPIIKIAFKAGKTAILGGQIDRVDVFEDKKTKESFVRIVDYKTGEKVFYLSDALSGINLPMLLYLFAIKKNGKKLLGDVSPAGILYMPVKRGLPDSKGNDTLAMNGMLVADKNVLTAMDKTNSGNFVPKLSTRNRKKDPNISKEDYDTVLDYVEHKVKCTAEKITDGIFDINPIEVNKKTACEYCDFAYVCGIDAQNGITVIKSCDTDEAVARMREELK